MLGSLTAPEESVNGRFPHWFLLQRPEHISTVCFFVRAYKEGGGIRWYSFY